MICLGCLSYYHTSLSQGILANRYSPVISSFRWVLAVSPYELEAARVTWGVPPPQASSSLLQL